MTNKPHEYSSIKEFLEQMTADKEAHRKRLAALPIMEKLRILDAMREQALLIKEAKRT